MYHYRDTRGRLSPGGLHGLQNRLVGCAEQAMVGSTPIRSRYRVKRLRSGKTVGAFFVVTSEDGNITNSNSQAIVFL